MIQRVFSAGLARGLGAVFGFLLSLAVGRLLGAAGAGQFFLGMTTMTLLSQVSRFGMPMFLLRTGSIYWEKGDGFSLRVAYRQSLAVVLALSLFLAAVLYLLSGWVAHDVLAQPAMVPTLRIFALVLIPFPLLWLNGGLLKAVHQPELANLVEAGLLPVLATALIVLLPATNVRMVSFSYLASCLAVGLFSTLFIAWTLRCRAKPCAPPDPIPWGMGFGFSTTVIAVCSYLVIWAPFMILGRFATDEVAGVFSVAQRTVMIISLVKVVVNSVYLPRFAPAHAAGDVTGLRKSYRTTVWLLIGGCGPLILLILMFPQQILDLFGADFSSGVVPLQILGAGYFLSIVFGPADEVLLMFGETRILRRLVYGILLVELAAAAILIPIWHELAAAAIAATAFIARSCGAWLWMQRKINDLERSTLTTQGEI